MALAYLDVLISPSRQIMCLRTCSRKNVMLKGGGFWQFQHVLQPRLSQV